MPEVEYRNLDEQIDKYLEEYNIFALMDTISYILSHFKIYMHVKRNDVILLYKDQTLNGFILTAVLRTGVAVKIKIDMDKSKEKVIGVDVWYVNE